MAGVGLKWKKNGAVSIAASSYASINVNPIEIIAVCLSSIKLQLQRIVTSLTVRGQFAFGQFALAKL